jgi:hypothetical protein
MAFGVADLLAPARGCIVVVLDQQLAGQVTPGGGSVARSLRMTLSLAGVAHETHRVHQQTLRDTEARISRASAGQVVVAILTPPTIAQVVSGRSTRLEPIATTDGSGVEFTVFTYRSAGLPTCMPPSVPPTTSVDPNDGG